MIDPEDYTLLGDEQWCGEEWVHKPHYWYDYWNVDWWCEG
jgi:hypothetical protein